MSGTCITAECDCVGFAYTIFTTYAKMQPNWYSTFTPKTAAGITAMTNGSDLLAFVKYMRGTLYYETAFNGDYLHGTVTKVTIGANKLTMAYIASISAAVITMY